MVHILAWCALCMHMHHPLHTKEMSADNTPVEDFTSTLKSFVKTVKTLELEQQAARHARAQKRLAKTALETLALERSEAEGGAGTATAFKLGDTPNYLVVSSKNDTRVSAKRLMECSESITPTDFVGAELTKESMVPLRTIISNTILKKLTTTKTQVKWTKKAPAAVSVQEITLDEEQSAWVQGLWPK